LRTIPHLRGRTKGFQATWKIRHHLTQAIHRVLEDLEFYQYYTPLITQADCEGAGETFDVKSDWMDEKLTVSGQLHGEVGMLSLGKIYTFSPCFRAEKSETKKHLSEFWMIEPEAAFFDLDQIIDLSEEFMKKIIWYVVDKCDYEFTQLGIDTDHLQFINQDWIRKTYSEICKEFKVKFGDDISSEVEKKISKKYGLPVFITHYPKSLKPFYMKTEGDLALCFDLIFPEVGEVIGGSQREEDYDKLKSEIIKAGIDVEKMDWYLSTRKWGSVPHAGFGMGFERILMYICKSQKIHDVIPFPISY
jgi:asparaginyl-tRNA synthetase